MKRFSLVVAAAALATGLLPSIASATEVELGTTTSPLVAPACPTGVSQSACKIVLTQVTALETVRDGVKYPTTVTKAGEVVAFTLGISALSTDAATVKKDLTYLDGSYGGTAQAELAVLRPVGPKTAVRYVVAAESQPFQLEPYLGQVVQFPLPTSLPVVPGEIIGLTVPTWAPVLSIDLTASKFAYSQSRSASCTNTSSAIQAQLAIGDQAGYKCNYTGTRVEYTATEVTSPTPSGTIRRAAGGLF